MKRADLDDFVACYNSENRNQRKETERFKLFAYDDLIRRDKANLDLDGTLVAALSAVDLGAPEGPPSELARKAAALFASDDIV